ncbi:MAG: hypothetical protein M3024_02260, partial [Candidatus Dormibacteraeota bacterium]|nr:hypothetical protein [Candidatus Dormibacteraeota bacterium]
MKVLASGVDTLNLSAKGTVRADVWDQLAEAQARAKAADEAVPFEFDRTCQAFMAQAYGRRGYAFLLTSPDCDLIVGRGERFPAVLVELRSAFLHSVGVDEALNQVEQLLRHDVLLGASMRRPLVG